MTQLGKNAILLLVMGIIPIGAMGCRKQAYNDLYMQQMAAEVRDLENRIYEYDHEYRALEEELYSLESENQKLKSELEKGQSRPRSLLPNGSNRGSNSDEPSNPKWQDRLKGQGTPDEEEESGPDVTLPLQDASNDPPKTLKPIPDNSNPEKAPPTLPDEGKSEEATEPPLRLDDNLPSNQPSPPAILPAPLLPKTDNPAAAPLLPSAPPVGPAIGPANDPAKGIDNLPSPTDASMDIEMGQIKVAGMEPIRPRGPTNTLRPQPTSNPAADNRNVGNRNVANPIADNTLVTNDSYVDNSVQPASASMPVAPQRPLQESVAGVVDRELTEIGFLAPLSVGIDMDNQPGDDGVSLVLQPRNSMGEFVDEAADLLVSIIDPNIPNENGRLGLWRIPAEEVRSAMRLRGVSRGIHLEIPLNGRLPSNRVIDVYVRYELPNGKKLVAQQSIQMARPGDPKNRWVSRDSFQPAR